jgi:hypothetical protein
MLLLAALLRARRPVRSGAAGVLIVQGDRRYTPPTPQNPYPIADIDTVLHDLEGTPLREKLSRISRAAIHGPATSTAHRSYQAS